MTTASEEVREREVQGELLPAAMPETLRRQGRTCATSVALPSAASLVPVTERVRAAGAQAASLLAGPGTLPTSQPPTFIQAHAQHRESADHFRSPVLRWLRMSWGWLHLLAVKPALNGLEWVTFSPLRLVITAAVIAAIWFWS